MALVYGQSFVPIPRTCSYTHPLHIYGDPQTLSSHLLYCRTPRVILLMYVRVST
jgi:hypothetical protein